MLKPPTLPLPIRMFNATGSGLRQLGLRSRLDPEQLIRTARKHTGLDDFGAGPHAHELGILVGALEREANLTSFGLFIVRKQLLEGLTIQLQVQDWFMRHPEIAQQKIERPIVIIGTADSGNDATGSYSLSITGVNMAPNPHVVESVGDLKAFMSPRPTSYDLDGKR